MGLFEVRRQAHCLLGGTQGLSRFVTGFKRQRQMVINVCAPGQPAKSALEVGYRRVVVPERKLARPRRKRASPSSAAISSTRSRRDSACSG